MTYIITHTIIDPWQRVLATAGTVVKIISDHHGTLIVEDKKGNRFPVKKEKLTKQPEVTNKKQ